MFSSPLAASALNREPLRPSPFLRDDTSTYLERARTHIGRKKKDKKGDMEEETTRGNWDIIINRELHRRRRKEALEWAEAVVKAPALAPAEGGGRRGLND